MTQETNPQETCKIYIPDCEPLDKDQVTMLYVADDEELGANMIRELIELYKTENAPKIQLIQRDCAAKDSASLRKQVHFIAGSSANLGLMRLSTFCRNIEAAIEQKKFTGFSDCYDRMQELYESGLRELTGFVEKKK